MAVKSLGVDALVQETRRAARTLQRSPGFTAIAVFTIAIGVGAAASMYGLLHSLVFAPPPHVADAGSVFRLHQAFPREDGSEEVFAGTSYPFFELLRGRIESIDVVAAYSRADVPVGSGEDARLARATLVSAGFWRVMGLRPVIGRLIDDREADPVSGSRVVVLGHGYWRRALGGKQDIVGTSLRIKGQPYTVIGVVPRGFRGVEFADVDLWLPLFAVGDGSGQPVTWHNSKTSFNMTVVARLRSGVQQPRVAAELTSVYRAFLEDAYGPGNSSGEVALRDRNRRARTLLGPVTGGLGGDLRLMPEARTAAWLVGIAFVLLAIACSNLASLLLLRAVARRTEIAVSIALGISRGRLAVQLLAESALLTLVGSIAAIVLVVWSSSWMQRTLLPAMASESVGLMDWSVLGIVVICACIVICAAGAAPLWHTSRYGVAALRDIVIRAPGKRPRVLTALLVTQCALTVVLLVGGGLFLRSLRNAQTEYVGFDRDDTLVVQIDFTGTGRSPADVSAFFERAFERARTIPGVARASIATDAPLRRARVAGSPRIPGRDEMPTFSTGGPYVNAVAPGFFATAGMHLLEGRDFVERERFDGAIVVNETMAKAYWPNASAVGQCLVRGRRQPVCIPIVGVVADARRSNLVEKERYLYYYVALSPNNPESRVLLVRKAPGAERVEAALRRLLVDLDPRLPFAKIETIGAALEPQMRGWRLGASVFTAFGALALVLAVIGLFSSASYDASQRTRELATRMALGATRASLVSLMLRNGLRVAGVGLVAGMVLALVSGRYMKDLLFSVSSADATVMIGVTAIVLFLATCANLLPAWRISRIDPAAALRAE
jgi:putative ABC transport system permease protein